MCDLTDNSEMGVKIFHFNPLAAACIIVWNEAKECIIADPGAYYQEEKKELSSFIRNEGLSLKMIILTHTHFDHIFGVADVLSEFGPAPVYMHKNDKPLLESAAKMAGPLGLTPPDVSYEVTYVEDGDKIGPEGLEFEVIHTPGHSPGSVCYLCRKEKFLISGDTLFAGTIGRTDLAFGDYDAIMESILTKLIPLENDIDVIPGHGGYTTICDEKMKNPFLQPFNEPLEEDE